MIDFEVLYIDKFADSQRSQTVLKEMAELFHLKPQACTRLSCGEPVVVKQHIDRETAEKIRRAIAATGGTCWIQEQPNNSHMTERRCNDRRSLKSRRITPRDNAIQPDRRSNTERRQNSIH